MASVDPISGAFFHVRRTMLVLAGAMFLLSSLPATLAAGTSGAQVRTVVIPITGMVCVACAATVKRALKAVDGVSQVEVSLETRAAWVTYSPDKVSPDRLVEAINKGGYKAGVPKEVE
jgi:copper chaperone CopZ